MYISTYTYICIYVHIHAATDLSRPPRFRQFGVMVRHALRHDSG